MSSLQPKPRPKHSPESWVVFVSSYPPRQCGIATYTKHLADAVAKQAPRSVMMKILAINPSKTKSYHYPRQVVGQVAEGDADGFRKAAEQLNADPRVKLVVISHEFGLFGGESGDALLPFLETIKVPVVTIFHTVLPREYKGYGAVAQRIIDRSDRIMVMNQSALKLLKGEYAVPDGNATVIPHGIPVIPAYSQMQAKKTVGLGGYRVLVSFGLLSPNKGYELVIQGLTDVVRQYPDVLYLILGQTHPNVLKKQGEAYRYSLEELAHELGLEQHVRFYNQYMAQPDIIKYLKAADIFISASQEPKQMVSGTLCYALGSGTATVSTPFIHARELAGQNILMLAEFQQPESFSRPILELFGNPRLQHEYEERAFTVTRPMTWPNIGLAFFKMIQPYLAHNSNVTATQLPTLPRVSLKHLMRLTDGFGVVQFADRSIPDIESGYCVDDVSRALVAITMHWVIYRKANLLPNVKKYLAFIEYVQAEDGRFFNFVDRQKTVNTADWSADAHARTLWALGYLMAAPEIPTDLKEKANQLLTAALPVTSTLERPRSMAFAVTGLYFALQYADRDILRRQLRACADALVGQFDSHAGDDWLWFENKLTYSNSKLPEALFYAYIVTQEERYLQVAETTLAFLIDLTIENGVFHPIGQDGWYERNGKRAYYDQQPVDVSSMVRTLTVAYRVTDNIEYRNLARLTYSWFLGNNALHRLLYNETTGGCHDGLGEQDVNQNQGAESTIVHLTARLCMDTRAKIL